MEKVDLEVLRGLVFPSLKIDNLELVFKAKNLARHHQDPTGCRGCHAIDYDWSHCEDFRSFRKTDFIVEKMLLESVLLNCNNTLILTYFFQKYIIHSFLLCANCNF
jgi:hypothetical protein